MDTRRKQPVPQNNMTKYDRYEKRGGYNKQKCIAYFERGVCERGDNCPYEHGQDRLVIDIQELDTNFRVLRGRRSIRGRGRMFGPESKRFNNSMDSNMNSGASGGGNGYQNFMDEEVDDDNVNVDLLDRQKMKNHMNSPNEEDGEIISSPGRDRDHKLLPKRPNDGQSTSLTVVGIPHPLNTIGKLSDHFSKFGDIVNIEVLQSQKKAVIKYNSHVDAARAIKSPEAVMGNRFIKVFWSSGDTEVAEVKKNRARETEESRRSHEI
jgi:RNA-binding protein 26